MNRNTSIYLDCARFLAAFLVMLCHVDEYVVKGIMPFTDHLGLESVGVFFVLSGFVIGYATEFREKELRTYIINRAARVYSVVIPCLTATLILDSLGRHFLYHFYYFAETFREEAVHVVLSFSFLTYSWLLPHVLPPGNDGPFWSLCFEVAYYAMFGAIWFRRGFWRWLVPVLTLLVDGNVLVYFPLWLLGLGLYRLCRSIELRSAPARAIFILSMLLWAGFEALVAKFDLCPSIAADIRHAPLLLYGSGLCFALSVIGFEFSGIGLGGIAKPVRWLAGATFTLYLLHFPLVWFLNGLMAGSPIAAWPPALRWALLIATTFGLVLAAAQVTERRKALWRRGMGWIFDRLEKIFDAGRSRLRKQKQALF